jgi:hypothetical protein
MAGKPVSEGLIIFAFDHDLMMDGTLAWARVAEEGAELLSAIQSLMQKQPVSQSWPCPILESGSDIMN